MAAMKNKNKGAVLIETALLLPMFLLLIFGIFEVYRIKVAERMLDTVSISIANEFAASGTMTSTRALEIIKRCNKENTLKLMSEEEITTRIKCNIDIYTNHADALNSTANITWSENIVDISSDSLARGDTVAVTCLFKYNFLTKLTQEAFTGASKGKDQQDDASGETGGNNNTPKTGDATGTSTTDPSKTGDETGTSTNTGTNSEEYPESTAPEEDNDKNKEFIIHRRHFAKGI